MKTILLQLKPHEAYGVLMAYHLSLPMEKSRADARFEHFMKRVAGGTAAVGQFRRSHAGAKLVPDYIWNLALSLARLVEEGTPEELDAILKELEHD